MKNNSHNVNGMYTVFSGGTQIQQIVRVASSHGFSRAGFGSGDGKTPVPGSYTIIDYTFPHGSVTSTGGGTTTDRVGVLWPDYSILESFQLTSDTNNISNQALSRLYSSINSGAPNAATDLGEGRDTVKLLASALSALRHPLDTAASLLMKLDKQVKLQKRLNKLNTSASSRSKANKYRSRRQKAAAESASNAVLLTLLALKPLASELYSAANYSSTIASQPIQGHKGFAKGVQTRVFTGAGGATVTDELIETTSYGVRFFIVDPAKFDTSRLGLLSPLSLVWELTRLSFVVDWFFNVGSYLSSLENSAGFGLKFISGYKTTVEIQSSTAALVSSATSGSVTTTKIIDASRRIVYKHRTSLSGFPTPAVPHLKWPISASGGISRLLIAAALVQKSL